jgi:hypothetical protein
MKRILPVLLVVSLVAEAGTPLPAQVFFGLVRNAYGFPYIDSARVVVTKGTTECARCDIGGILPDGLNYRLTLDMDSGGTPYAPYAVKTGDALALSVELGGVASPLMPTNRLVAGAPGSTVRLDLCTGTDADGDGLPDEWELLLCEQSGGRLAGIVDVNPNDDFDGDGMSNEQEFRACTFAFLRTDLLKIGDFQKISETRFKARFLSSLGVTYKFVATGSLNAGSWYPLRFALREGEAVSYRELVGDGNYQAVIVEAEGSMMFIRLVAQVP